MYLKNLMTVLTGFLCLLLFRRRCEIAETLIERNFDLAFQVVYEFNLPGGCIFVPFCQVLIVLS